MFSFVRNAPTRKLVLTAFAVLGLLASVTAIAVAYHVNAGTITSSPGPIPYAPSAHWSVTVPLMCPVARIRPSGLKAAQRSSSIESTARTNRAYLPPRLPGRIKLKRR